MRAYLLAARPRTLAAAVVPVVVGTAAAATPSAALDPVRALLALVVALALQVAVNYANDYFDGVRGVDTDARVGPRRAVATGLISPQRMRVAIVAALAVAGAAGLVLAALAGWELLLVGLAAMLAALGYSGGPRPYASAGLGEVMVFVFFGLVATVGAAYVQDERLTRTALLAALPVGALAVALLLANNLRDIPTDRAAGKVTLAVRLGEARTRALFAATFVVAYVSLVALALDLRSGWLALPVLSLPVAWPALATVRATPIGPGLVAALGATARVQLLFGALLAVALAVAEPAAAVVAA